MDLTIRRTRLASPDVMKQALRQPRETKVKKVKNVKQSILGTVINVHKEKQDLGQMQTRKMKGLKRKRGEEATTGDGPAASGDAQEASAGSDAGSAGAGKKKRADEEA